MRGALVILLALVVIGFLLWCYEQRRRRRAAEASARAAEKKRAALREAGKTPDEVEAAVAEGEPDVHAGGGVCCGMHAVCEKTGTVRSLTDEDLYYNDEELDRFRGRRSDEYTAEEAEEFREVLTTLRMTEIPDWDRALELRGITPPTEVRDEMIILLADLMADAGKTSGEGER